ncbi:MAG: hypothetical protein Fur0010_06320 [Bdellovibrio sp.]
MKFLTLLFIFLSTNVFANSLLTQWAQDPEAFKFKLPEHQGAESFKSIPSASDKIKLRNKLFNLDSSHKAELPARENAAYLLELSQLINRPEEMEKLNLLEGRAERTPWSDDYWPIYAGILGKRYSDPMFAYKDNWFENHQYILDVPARQVFATGDLVKINQLSPSEKYDLLVGDDQFSLTSKMWSEGKPYWDRYGEVESWMGICHGWAPASIQELRPQSAVKVKDYNQAHDITFYPADIKALASLLWANARYDQRFIGSRCNLQEPEEDEDGRTTTPECFDNNPAAWHLTVVNGMGVHKRSFVFDATYDYQVWNQPLVSYRFSFFNPQTLKEGVTFKEAVVEKLDFGNDKFKKYRSSKMAKVVGVEMSIEYAVEVGPEAVLFEGENFDRSISVSYLYDLELDESGQIIGGEWYQNAHPDFIWSPTLNTMAESPYDAYVQGSWSSQGPVPAQWKKAAAASSKRGLPLRKVVQKLIESSRQR